MDKTTYYQGEELSYSGFEYKLLYYDGTYGDGDITIEGNYDGMMDVVGTHTLTCYYYNDKPGDPIVTKDFDIEVVENSMTLLTVTGAKTEYHVGESFNSSEFLSGASATVTYSYTGTESISVGSLQIVESPNLLVAGTSSVTLRYTNKNNDTVETTIPVSVYAGSGTINVTYQANPQFTYNGNSHAGSVDFSWTTNGLPSFVVPIVTLVPMGGFDPDTGLAGVYGLVPQITRVENSSGQDITGQYDITIEDGAGGVLYFVNPASASVTLRPASSTNHPGDTVTITYTASGIVGDDQVVLENTEVSYGYVGTYEDYPTTVHIYHQGMDVTGLCYSLDINRESVVVTD